VETPKLGKCPVGWLMPRIGTSGDDVRDAAIRQDRDLVPQAQLALFEARDLQLIGLRIGPKCLDALVQCPVFGLQFSQPLGWLVVIHIGLPLPLGTQGSRQGANAIRRAESSPRDKRAKMWFTPKLSRTSKGNDTMEKAQVDALASQHAALQSRIDLEEQRPQPDDVLVHRLKKEKLRLKDEMLGLVH
jgi:hypothetical protein